MIKNVVFDLGFVLISFDWREIMTNVGITEDEMEEIATATVRSEYWGELDRGVLTDEEILNGFISLAPQHKEKITKFFAAVPHNMPRIRRIRLPDRIEHPGGRRLYLHLRKGE